MQPGVNPGVSAWWKFVRLVLQLPDLPFVMLFLSRSPINMVAKNISFYVKNHHSALQASADELTCTHEIKASGIYQRMILYLELMTTEGLSNRILSAGGNLANKASS